MQSRSDTYQPFIPTLKPKTFSSRPIFQKKLKELKSKLVNNQPHSSTSKPLTHSTINLNFNKLVSSSLPLQRKNSNFKINPAFKNLSRLSKASEGLKPEKLRKHFRFFSTVEEEAVKINSLVTGESSKKSVKGVFTERVIRKKKQKRKLVILESLAIGMEEKWRNEGGSEKRNEGKKVERGERKVVMLDKHVECNDSIISSLSSPVYERIPRYSINK